MLITKKNKKQGLQFDFRGSPSSAICEHILQSLSYNKIKKNAPYPCNVTTIKTTDLCSLKQF